VWLSAHFETGWLIRKVSLKSSAPAFHFLAENHHRLPEAAAAGQTFCDSTQRTAKRINSGDDFSLSFVLMLVRWTSTVLTLR